MKGEKNAMFYLLNFNDHSFVSCDDASDVHTALEPIGLDDDTAIIIDVYNPGDQLCVTDFKRMY